MTASPAEQGHGPRAGSRRPKRPLNSTEADLAADPSADTGAGGLVEEVAERRTRRQVLQAERDDFQEKWLRVVAELDNVRKRTRREVAEVAPFRPGRCPARLPRGAGQLRKGLAIGCRPRRILAGRTASAKASS